MPSYLKLAVSECERYLVVLASACDKGVGGDDCAVSEVDSVVKKVGDVFVVDLA